MVTEPRRRMVPAADPNAEQVCSLDATTASKRDESPEGFLALSTSQETSENSTLFRFASTPDIWERTVTFIDEERDCCPFFSFEQWEEGDEMLLRISRPDQE